MNADAAADWESRLADTWAMIDDLDEEAFRAAIDACVEELPSDDPIRLFERGAAFDSTGHSDHAVPLYREALAAGLSGLRRRRAVIQMSSSLRNLGHADESVALLTAERSMPSDELDDGVTAFLALALADTGEERRALALALDALSRHMTRYSRSLSNYAAALLGEDEGQDDAEDDADADADA